MASEALNAIADHISRDKPMPLYAQVSEYLRERILSGELQPGDSIPAQNELTRLCDVSQITVRRAVQDLVNEGMLVSMPGSGTYVSENAGSVTEILNRPITDTTQQTECLNIGEVFSQMNVLGLSHVRGLADGIRSALDNPPFIHYYELPFNAPNAHEIARHIPLGNLDGLLLHSPCNLDLISRCRLSSKPHVLLYNNIADGFSHCVSSDYVSAMFDCVEHLVSRSKKKIALVTASAERYSSGRMVQGFQMALRHFKLPPSPPQWIMHEEYGEGPGHVATMKLLNLPDPPDAIIYRMDVQAKGGLMAARELGVDVPEELAVVGHGNNLRPKEALIELTTIDPHPAELGRVAMTTLKQLIDGDRNVPFFQFVIPKLIVRQST
jgi:GntR family transcriptional regulator of arabinose operon